MARALSRSTASRRAVRWDEPLYTVERAEPDETHTRIGEQVATLIEDGATLQLGIGAIPDATLRALGDRRNLGVHSEMFSDGVLDLVERGVITGARKAIDRGKIVASFVIGSRSAPRLHRRQPIGGAAVRRLHQRYEPSSGGSTVWWR